MFSVTQNIFVTFSQNSLVAYHNTPYNQNFNKMSELTCTQNGNSLRNNSKVNNLIGSKDWNNTILGNIENWSAGFKTTLKIVLNAKLPTLLLWGPESLSFYNDAYQQTLGNDGGYSQAWGQPANESRNEIWNELKVIISEVYCDQQSSLNEDRLIPIYQNEQWVDAYWTLHYSKVENELDETEGILITCCETTQKVQVLDKLVKNEDKLNAIIDATNLGVWHFNPETRIFNCNNRINEWLGIENHGEISFETALQTLPKEERKRTLKAMLAVVKPGSGGKYEIRNTVTNRLTNQEIILLLKGKAVFNEKNQCTEVNGTVQDITERVLAQRKIEESEEELRFALDGGNLGYFNSYPQQDIINWSAKSKEFFGISPDAVVNLETYKNAIHPEDSDKAIERLLEALKQENNSLYVNEFRTANTNKWLSVKGKLKINENSKLVRITGIIQDITESKLSEKRILESEYRFRNMVHNSPFLISILKGEDFIIDVANDAIIDAWGKGNDVLGKPILTVIPEIIDQGFEALLKNVYQTGIPFVANGMPVYITKNGIPQLRYFTFVYQAQRNFSGDVDSITILANDVTEQAELTRKLQESEILLREIKEQLELTFANVPAAIFLYSNNKDLIFASEKAANMLGYESVRELLLYTNYDQLIKKTGRDFYIISEKNEAITDEHLPIESALKSGEHKELVFSMQKKSGGNKIWYLNKSAPILDVNGNVSMVLTTSTDITAQKLAEEAIRDSEIRFRLLADNAPMWVWITDMDVNVLYANLEILNHIGLNHYSEFTGKVWQEVVHPEDIITVLESFQKSSVEQTNFDFEARVKNVETNIYEWFYLKGTPKYENGEFVGFIGTGINIHQQKIQLFALEQSEQRFMYLVETLPQMVCVMNQKGDAEYITNKWEKYTGIKPGETLKMWQKIVHPDDMEYAKFNWFESMNSGKLCKFDLRLRSKEGHYRWFTVNSEPIFDSENKITKWVSAFTDVHTEKSFSQELEKQVSERTNELLISNELMLQKNDLLRISENFNRSLTDISPNIVYIYDTLEDKPFFLNSTYLAFTGYDWQEVKALGKNFMPRVIHSDDYESLQEAIEKIKNSESGEIFEAKCQIKNAKGLWIPFLNRLTVFKRDDNQNVTQVIGVAIDISELKSAEKVLEQKNEELLKMNKELESFAYVSSHDLQEPLRKIQTFTSRIMEKEYDNLSENGQNYLNRMRVAAERMQQLINDLLAYSRTKVQERKFENVDLVVIIREVEDDLKDDFAKKKGRIEMPESCRVNVIPFQFRQLIYNLLSNAIKFAKSDENLLITVKFDVIKGYVVNHANITDNKEYCHISVADNGIGFDSSYKDKIFEIFQRLHGREEYTGTGIGLAIVKKIVDNHNGLITADGELNKGATFNIYIPFE